MVRDMNDAVGYVANHPGMFFRRGAYSPEELAAHVASEALLSGVSDLVVSRHGPWWIIRSSTDWFADPSALDWFHRLVPFPEGGQNASRSEVLITAFAVDVITVDGEGDRHVVKGVADDSLDREFTVVPRGGRLIAFR